MVYCHLFICLASLAIANGWKACSRSASDFNECFAREVNFAVSTLINGHENIGLSTTADEYAKISTDRQSITFNGVLHKTQPSDKKLGTLPLDPLRVTTLEIPRHDSPVSISLIFKDIDITGLKDLKITKTEHDWVTTKGTAFVPDLYIIGDYKIDGQVLVVPVQGEGKCNLTFADLELDIDASWKQIEQNGAKYYQLEKLHLDLKPKMLYLHLDNLFNGNKALGDNANLFLNENWSQILAEMKAPLTSGVSQALTQIANRILSKVPAEEIDIK